MIHRANAGFWHCYNNLSLDVSQVADKQFALLKSNPNHGSIQFKKIGIRSGKEIWSARITLKYRTLAFRDGDDCVWFWIGEHNLYEMLIKG